MTKKHLSISMLLFVLGFTGIAGATSMNYPLNILQDSGYQMRHDADDIDGLLKKISVLKPSHPKPLKRATELNWSNKGNPDIFKRLLGGKFKSREHPDSIESIHMPAGYQSSNTSSVPEPATMLLLGSGLVVIAGLGRRKIHKNRKH